METLLLAYDDSEPAKAALRWTTQYALAHGARVLMTYAVSSAAEWELAAVQVNPDPIRHRIEQSLEGEWSEPLRAAGVAHETRLLVGKPTEQIVQCATDEGVDLIVLGMSPSRSLSEVITGSVARHVLRHSHTPVVVVPPDWVTPARVAPVSPAG